MPSVNQSTVHAHRDLVLRLLTDNPLTEAALALLPEDARDTEVWQQYFLAEGTAAIEQLHQAASRRFAARTATTTVLDRSAGGPTAVHFVEVNTCLDLQDDGGIAVRIFARGKSVGPVGWGTSDIREAGPGYALVEIEGECGTVDNEYYVWGSLLEDWLEEPDCLERRRWCLLLRDGALLGFCERTVSYPALEIREAVLCTREGHPIPTSFLPRDLPADIETFREAFVTGATTAPVYPSPRRLCGSSKSHHHDGDVIASFSSGEAEIRFVVREDGRSVRLEGDGGFSRYICKVGGFRHDGRANDERGTHHIRLLNVRESAGDTFLEGVAHCVDPDRTVARRLIIVLRHGRLIAVFPIDDPNLTIVADAVLRTGFVGMR
ncbi:MAG: hypothetical protein HY270_00430 [Deltaproteobacteria bacterium]|nr:hypothetical protein [Deltaproteobacteria bacterium]